MLLKFIYPSFFILFNSLFRVYFDDLLLIFFYSYSIININKFKYVLKLLCKISILKTLCI